MSSLAKYKNDTAGAFKKKKYQNQMFAFHQRKKNPEEKIKSEEKIKFLSFYFRVHIKNISDLSLFIGF